MDDHGCVNLSGLLKVTGGYGKLGKFLLYISLFYAAVFTFYLFGFEESELQVFQILVFESKGQKSDFIGGELFYGLFPLNIENFDNL